MPSSALDAAFEITGVVQDQHTIRLAELVSHVGSQVVADPVGVPHRSAEQALHAVRRTITSMFGQLPTRPSVHIRQQPEQERLGLPARLHPPEPTSDSGERRVELFPPPINVYAGSHGHRTILSSVHNGSRSDGGRTHARLTLDVDRTVTKIDHCPRNEPGLEY